MANIRTIEKKIFLDLFNRGGYVLNFSTSKFDAFTKESIGIGLCENYKLSKGGSLSAYVNDAAENNIIKLFKDLFDYYETYYYREIEERDGFYYPLYKKAKKILENIPEEGLLSHSFEEVDKRFSNEYLSSIIKIMQKAQFENPTEAIGKAKEIIESCCVTILENNGAVFNQNWNLSQLTKETMKVLKISINDLDENNKSIKSIKPILGGLQAIAGNISELRNQYGSGHGKSASFKGLQARHAKLAVGSSIVLVQYLWDTWEWRNQQEIKNK